MQFEKIEDKVLYVLKQNEQARSDDFLLICEVYKLENRNVTKSNFEEVMNNHKNWKLPSFHSITRARRKLFERYPELKPIKYLCFAFSIFFATLLFISNFIYCPMTVQLALGCLAVGFALLYEMSPDGR